MRGGLVKRRWWRGLTRRVETWRWPTVHMAPSIVMLQGQHGSLVVRESAGVKPSDAFVLADGRVVGIVLTSDKPGVATIRIDGGAS